MLDPSALNERERREYWRLVQRSEASPASVTA